MVDLTQEEQNLLQQIVTDKFSVGAFSGMIFNGMLQPNTARPDVLIQEALKVRLLAMKMAETGKSI